MADIDFGSGPNTPTGDLVSEALVKLQDRIDLLVAGGAGFQLGKPALTIGNSFTATGIAAGAPALGGPALGQNHVVSATGVTSTPSLGVPALSTQTLVTWNPSDKHAGLGLSSGNLTASVVDFGSDGYIGARATLLRSSGRFYFELAPSWSGDSDMGVGLANASAPLNDYAGADTNSVAIYGGGSVYLNGSVVASAGALTSGAAYGFDVNLTTRRLHIKGPSGWIVGGDPDAGGSGLDISAVTGSLTPFTTLGYPDDTTTGNFGASAFARTRPAGSTPWNVVT